MPKFNVQDVNTQHRTQRRKFIKSKCMHEVNKQTQKWSECKIAFSICHDVSVGYHNLYRVIAKGYQKWTFIYKICSNNNFWNVRELICRFGFSKWNKMRLSVIESDIILHPHSNTIRFFSREYINVAVYSCFFKCSLLTFCWDYSVWVFVSFDNKRVRCYSLSRYSTVWFGSIRFGSVQFSSVLCFILFI